MVKFLKVNNLSVFFISKSLLGYLAFLCLMPLDAVSLYFELIFERSVPIGMVGLFVACILSFFIFFEEGLSLGFSIFQLLALFLFSILVMNSEYGDIAGVYFFVRAFFLFCAGYYFCAFLCVSERLPGKSSLYLLLIVFSALSMFIPLYGVNYLRVADGFVFLAFLLLASCRSQFSFVAIAIASTLIVYYIGSRFALIGFCAAVGFLAWMRSRVIGRVALLISATSLMIILYFVGSIYFSNLESVHENRVLRLFYAPGEDSSLSARGEFLVMARDVIADNPIIGKYKYYQDDLLTGAYAHNLVSYWAEFGIFGFLYSMLLIVFSVAALACAVLAPRRRVSDFSIFVNFYFLLGVLFSKSYHWSTIYYLFGWNLFFCIIVCREFDGWEYFGER